MPIKIAEGFPVQEKLQAENIFVIDHMRARSQDIRPLKILVLNLMPKKEQTELHLLRLIGNTPLQIEVEFLHTASYQSRNISKSHLENYYKTFAQIKDERYDGLIITGAPVEQMAFDQVDYYDELVEILKWSETNVHSRFFICWGAQFGLNHYYGIEKIRLPKKLFGIYQSFRTKDLDPFLRGFDDVFNIPQSRHTKVDFEAIYDHEDLRVLSEHPSQGPDIVKSVDNRDLFIFGHLEYDRYVLEEEYQRDLSRGLDIAPPKNYYPDDDPDLEPLFIWKSHAHLLFSNWINQVYQETEYDLADLSGRTFAK